MTGFSVVADRYTCHYQRVCIVFLNVQPLFSINFTTIWESFNKDIELTSVRSFKDNTIPWSCTVVWWYNVDCYEWALSAALPVNNSLRAGCDWPTWSVLIGGQHRSELAPLTFIVIATLTHLVQPVLFPLVVILHDTHRVSLDVGVKMMSCEIAEAYWALLWWRTGSINL